MSEQIKSGKVIVSDLLTCTKSRRWFKLGGVMLTAVTLLFVALLAIRGSGYAAPMAPNLAITMVSVEPRSNDPNTWVTFGDRITYTIRVNNFGDEATDNTVLTDTLGAGLGYVTATPAPDSPTSGDVLTWDLGTMAPASEFNLVLVVEPTESYYVMHTRFESGLRVTGDWSGGLFDRSFGPTSHYFESAVTSKQHTSQIIFDPPDTFPNENLSQNKSSQAVAGEAVTLTVFYTVPANTVAYSVTPRLLLEDGLWPDPPQSWVSEVITTRLYRFPNGPMDERAAVDGYQLTFDPISVITGPHVLSYTVYVHPEQYRYLVDSEPAGRLQYQPLLRWCDMPACTSSTLEDTDLYYVSNTDNPRVEFRKPNTRVDFADFTHTFLDPKAIGVGGGDVRFDMTLRSNGPTAHNLVYTATLGPGLSYLNSYGEVGPEGGSPLGEGSVFTMGNQVYITWTLPFSMANNTTWPVWVQARFPDTIIVGEDAYTCTSDVKFETFAGDVPHEGVYRSERTHDVGVAGSSNSKTVWSPETDFGNWVAKIGDTVVYTVVTVVGSDTILTTPYYTDTLPEGFHYVDGSFSVEGASFTGPVIAADTTVVGREDMRWDMPTQDRTGQSTLYITATYEAELTGMNTADAPAYVLNLNSLDARNWAVLYWDGGVYNELDRLEPRVSVRQPNLKNNNFKTNREDATDGDEEVGGDVSFKIDFRNVGGADGFDVHICDTLPQGFAYTPVGETFDPGTCPATRISPVDGAEGEICWIVDRVCRNVDFSIKYTAIVLPSAIPDIPRTNDAHISDYSSQPGGTNDGDMDDNDLPAGINVDRHYSDYPDIAFPVPQQCGAPGCPFTVLGLAASKYAWRTNVMPGEFITYTLLYTDTSPANDYTGLVITDTYDASLNYVGAEPAPTSHDPGQNLLVWELGALSTAGSGEVTLTMQVDTVVIDQYLISNTMMWDSAETDPHTYEMGTPLNVASLNLSMQAPMTTHAGAQITWTVAYSNAGSTSQPLTMTLDYGPYLSYDSHDATGASVSQEADNVFVDTLVPNNGQDYFLTIVLNVDAPLPYTLDHLEGSILGESRGTQPKTDNVYINLARPILVLEKVGPSVAGSALGTPIEYEIYLTNVGSYTVTGMVLTDTWSANTDYSTDNHDRNGWIEPSVGATAVTRTEAILGIGESIPLPYVFEVSIANVSAFYTNTVYLISDQTSEQSASATVWSASIATSKAAEPIPAFPGRVLTYTIYYTNTNPPPGAFTNVLITDTLPSGFVYLPGGHSEAEADGCPGGWTFDAPDGSSGGEAIWGCASLDNGATGEFLIWGLVETAVEGTDLVNVTHTSAQGVDVRPIESPLVIRVARPWLRIDKVVEPLHPVAPGDLLHYTLTYENYGTDPAHDVVISDVLPAQVTFDSCSDGCMHDAGLVTWDFAEVPTGTMGSVALTVTVNAGTGGQTAVNELYAIRSARLPISETQTGDPVSSTILDPHLSATKAASPTLVTGSNEPITYTITYTNDGGGILTNVGLTDDLSEMTVFDAASPECSGPAGGVGGTVTCDLGGMAQGTSASVYIVVKSTSQGGWITNTAVLDSDQTDPEATNATYVYNGTCQPPYNVSFDYTPADPVTGETITFTAAAEGPDLTYSWTFGDGDSDMGAEVYHSYALSDTYNVSLVVANTCDSVTVDRDVTVAGGASLSWSPASFSKMVEEGATDLLTSTLILTNTGTAELLWTVSVTPSATTWLSIAAVGQPTTVILPGSTAPQSHSVITVYFDPTGLTAAGSPYEAFLNITSNAMNASSVDLPATLTVTSGDFMIYLPLVSRES